MSTCPDKIIYSEYIDGELPSPWKEKLETHIEKCSDCDLALKNFSTIREAMHSDDDLCDSFDCNASYERLKTKFRQGDTNLSEKNADIPSFWKTAIKLPLPAIAAAALALVILPTVFFISKKSSVGQQQVLATNYLFNPVKQANYNASLVPNSGMQVGNFSSSISEFMSMYMPSSNESAEVIIIKIPSSRLDTDLNGLFPAEDITVKTKETSE